MNHHHLNETQFADALLGMAEPEVEAHLAACAACSEELERVSGGIAVFREASESWSRQRVAALPPVRKPGLLERLRFSVRPAAGFALAAGLAVAAVVPVMRSHMQSEPVEEATVEHHAPVLSDDQLASDNELLSDIDQAINQPAAVQQAAYVINQNSSASVLKH